MGQLLEDVTSNEYPWRFPICFDRELRYVTLFGLMFDKSLIDIRIDYKNSSDGEIMYYFHKEPKPYTFREVLGFFR